MCETTGVCGCDRILVSEIGGFRLLLNCGAICGYVLCSCVLWYEVMCVSWALLCVSSLFVIISVRCVRIRGRVSVLW